MIEIERKFLVNSSLWEVFKKNNNLRFTSIKQAYIFSNETVTARVRTKSNSKANTYQGFLTLKGTTIGISRSEFEYEIPILEAEEMMRLYCNKYMDKRRFTFQFEGKIWEVDEFDSPNPDLILAEIELASEVEPFIIPDFILKEVSDDAQYFNVNMLKDKT